MTLFRYALITTLAFSTALVGCGDDSSSGGNDNGMDAGMEEGGTSDAGEDAGPDPESLIEAGPPADLPATDSQDCMDSNATDFTPYEEADCDSYGDGNCGACWSQSAPEADGYCAGFFCNWTEIASQCQLPRPVGACQSDADLTLSCDGSIQNAVAKHARDAQGNVIGKNWTQDMARAYTKAKAREDLLKKNDEQVSPDCLDCYVVSAECARDKCLSECLLGDSFDCDTCRQDNGCTPAFYKCAGLPDPNKVNPDGSKR